MELLAAVAGCWVAVSALAVLGGAAVCRAGHAEDVARGFAEPDEPVPGRQAAEVTAR